jgi:phage shock protein E
LVAEDCFLVDVRTKEEFKEVSYPGSINIPLAELKNNLSIFKDKKNIVVFCRSGYRSAEAKFLLEKNGISPVCNGGSYKKLQIQF